MDIIEVSEEDKAFVRKYYDVTETDIKRDVRIIQEWLKKQPHLPQISDESFIERVLVRKKFRVEKAKECIDSYFTVKSICPEFFQDLHKIVPSKNGVFCYLLEKLTENRELILVASLKAPPEEFDFMEMIRLGAAHIELSLQRDYSLGFHVIIDMTITEMGHLKKISNINLLQKSLTALFQFYSPRVRGIYLYNPPSLVSLIMDIIRPFLQKKIMDRISVHKNSDSLLELIPKELLPVDFGGTNESMNELIEKADKLFQSNEKFLEEIAKIRSNEELRIGKCFLETDMFGIDGTFKKLNID